MDSSGYLSNPINVDADMEDEENEEPESLVLEKGTKRPKALTSDVWQKFTIIGRGDDGIQRAKCNGCRSEYKCGGDYGTSTLRRHAKVCTKLDHANVGQIIMDMQGKLAARKIDPLVVRDMLACAVIEHDLPFKFVEFKRIRSLINYLNPDSIPVTRNTIKADVMKIYMREKEKLKKEFSSIPTRISLTSDLWTSCTTEGYICLTAHYVDSNWKLRSKIINFCHLPPPHDGPVLAWKILEFLNDWGINKKIMCLTLDNAAANVAMVKQVKDTLVVENSLLCDGQFFHLRCSAHILNLIVQDGLQIGTGVFSKIRESIKYVRGSEGRKIKFMLCVEKIGGINTSTALCKDVPTRWNSTYLMLASALPYKDAFAKLHNYDDKYDIANSPTVEEWKRAQKLHDFLKPFYTTTTLISGTSYPTANLYFMQVWKIECALLDTLGDDDELLKAMATKMHKKFRKYWSVYSSVLAMGAALDPRVKLESLSYCFQKVDTSTSEIKLEVVKRNLYMLFEKYTSIHATSMQNTSQTQRVSQDTEYDELDKHKKKVATTQGKSQLDLYFDEPSLSFGDNKDLDVLQWWKENNSRFFELSIMARDLLCIPITTVASESAFSIGSHVLNKYRSRLLSKNVEALMCTRNWLNGFVGGDDDGDDEDLKDGDGGGNE